MTEDFSQPLAPVAVPLLGSLVLTGGVVWLSSADAKRIFHVSEGNSEGLHAFMF